LLLCEEGFYGFFFDAGVGTKIFDGHKASAGLTQLFSYSPKELAGGFAGQAGDIAHIFGVDHYTVGDRIHKQGF
jgi:hypothetical protein